MAILSRPQCVNNVHNYGYLLYIGIILTKRLNRVIVFMSTQTIGKFIN